MQVYKHSLQRIIIMTVYTKMQQYNPETTKPLKKTAQKR